MLREGSLELQCSLKSYIANILIYFSRDDVEKAKSSGDWKAIHDFYSTTFDSFLEINAAFKVEKNS